MMEISNDELRAMVREVIARQGTQSSAQALAPDHRMHASHGVLALVTGGDADGRCLIEPAVNCTHCGYCLSLGH